MSIKRLSLLIIAALALLVIMVPESHASTTECPANNAEDTRAKQAAALNGQAADKIVTDAWSKQVKIDVGTSYCSKALISAYNAFVDQLQGVSDPAGFIGGILGKALGDFLNSTCTSVISSIASDANTISSLARICIPISGFGLPGLPGLNLSPCSGGTQINLISNDPNAKTNVQWSNSWVTSGSSSGTP
jgi:hypothetical protein